MLNVTRTWNSVSAVGADAPRPRARARLRAAARGAFGAPLAEKPLHADTLAGLQAESEAAFHLTFFVVELLGREEARRVGRARGRGCCALLTPSAKLTTGRAGGRCGERGDRGVRRRGLRRRHGLPALLRDAQVLPIWEGTTNVLSLDALRTALKDEGALASLKAEVESLTREASDERLARPARAAREAVAHAESWLAANAGKSPATLEAGARRFSMTLGRALSLALLTRHAHWSLEQERDTRAAAAARRFALNGVDLIEDDADPADALALMDDR